MLERIQKLLIANRGEIARRIIRTCREMGISTVAVYADDDARSPFVREADEAVALNGLTATDTYLDPNKIIAAAQRTGANAIHPGYGFLSERADFARAVVDAGLIWVGPHPNAIAAMGNKLAAKKLVAAVGVPLLPGIALPGSGEADLSQAERDVGLPLLVKAAAGGGGRGMRIVRETAAIAGAIDEARREASNAFGDDAVFLERLVEHVRHVEVQIFGDKHGSIVHLFERECSIQRRHQKVVEEAPSSAVSPDLRQRLGAAAIAAASAVGYDNAGTVEFLLDPDGRFYFLEVNTRLQVEHPVTEAITGLDLVREQIRVAEGVPLSFSQADLRSNGHAIEARLYAENPANNFLPVSGTIATWEADPRIPARIDSGVESGSVISLYFDPMLAKVISHASTRIEAAQQLAQALKRLRLHGLITNRDFLVHILEHPAFLRGDTATDFIEVHRPEPFHVLSPDSLIAALTAAALAAHADRRATASVLQTLPSGWRNNPSQPQRVRFVYDDREFNVAYQLQRDGSFAFTVMNRSVVVRSLVVELPRLLVEINGLQREFAVTRAGATVFVQLGGEEATLVELPRFPNATPDLVAGGYKAPMPGKVVQVTTTPGAQVKRGSLLIILEAMKMEHRIVAAGDGTVSELRVTVGQQVADGQVLLVLEPD